MEQQQSNVLNITMDVEPHLDNKYVVIKRSDLEAMLLELGCNAIHDAQLAAEWGHDTVENYSLSDAVVIRTKDVFAGPALHSYAHNIALVASQTANLDTAMQLRHVADYFADRAREADVQAYEETAKLPD